MKFIKKISAGDALLWAGVTLMSLGLWQMSRPASLIFVGAFCVAIGVLQLRAEKK